MTTHAIVIGADIFRMEVGNFRVAVGLYRTIRFLISGA
jgi:hypothetical protein